MVGTYIITRAYTNSLTLTCPPNLKIWLVLQVWYLGFVLSYHYWCLLSIPMHLSINQTKRLNNSPTFNLKLFNPWCIMRPHNRSLVVGGKNPLAVVGGPFWKERFIYIYFKGRVCKVYFILMFWKIALGFLILYLFFIELMANLPIGEQFPNGIDISLKTIDFEPQMVFISKEELLGIFFSIHTKWNK